MLMLRAVWKADRFDYQLLDIPLELLGRMSGAQLTEVGTRPGRRSIAGDVMDRDKKLFHVHFDGADGKCQVQGLAVDLCRMLRSWQHPIE